MQPCLIPRLRLRMRGYAQLCKLSPFGAGLDLGQ
jgi:hypothetical protein